VPRVLRWSAASAALVLAASSSLAMPRSGTRWYSLDTAHGELTGSVPPLSLEQIGLDVERLRGALSLVTRHLELDSPVPTRLFVFTGTKAPVAGIFVKTPVADYILVDAAAGLDPARIAYHELLHEVVANNYPTAPLWFNEGLAELFSNFWTNGYRIEIGAPQKHHLRSLESAPMMPLEQLFAVSPDSPAYTEDSRKDLFHAESWLLVHYLLVGDADRRGRLQACLAALARGQSSEVAILHAFGLEPRTLLAALDGYRRREALPLLTIDLPEPLASAVGQATLLPRAEVLYRLGDLIARTRPSERRRAERHFREALKLDPEHAGALAALARLENEDEVTGPGS
jgi:hypothetical protein